MMKQVRSLHVVPDCEDLLLRKDQTGEFDYSGPMVLELFTRTPGAKIFYSLTQNETEAPAFQEYSPQDGIRVAAPPLSTENPSQRRYYLKAFAVCPGMKNSPLLERCYILTKKASFQTLVTPLLNSNGLVVENAYRIRDYDNDNMFLFNGKKAALLYDTGFYAQGGDLLGKVRSIIGDTKPLYVVLSHNGPDHIQMAWQFVDKPLTKVYINNRDRYMLEKHVRETLGLPDNEATKEHLAKSILQVKEGDVFDIGDRQFRAFEVPGHTFGCVALLDAGYGDFLVGDCIGASIPLNRASLWMWNIVPRVPLNDYLSILMILRDKLEKYTIREVYGGHYNRPLKGNHLSTYLDNLQSCVERLIDFGVADTEIADGYPPHAYVARCQTGNQFTNPYYAAIVTSEDLMFEPEYLDGNDEKNADLCYLRVSLPGEEENLLVSQPDSGLGISLNFVYHQNTPRPEDLLRNSRTRIDKPSFTVSVPQGTDKLHLLPVTGSHFSRLYIQGERFPSDYVYEILLNEEDTTVVLRVESEDGTVQRTYELKIKFELGV